jgi:dihydropyrimidinase
VLPGGVDPHAHPLSDVRPATVSALHGGTPTVLAFTLPRPGESPAAAWRRAERDDVPRAAVDVRLHPAIWEPDRLTRADLEELRSLGATSVKLYLAYPELGMMASDRTLYETLRAAGELGLLTMVHCENGGAIEALVDEQLAAGRTGVEGFVAARPPEVEEEAVGRVLALARLAGAPVYLVHLSTRGSLELVRDARRRGQAVWAEACTHHLLLDDSCYAREDPLAFLTVPPLRPHEHVEALWEGVLDGTIDAIGSDHAQVAYRPDVPEGDFRAFPYGFAGIEVRVPAILSEGRRRGVPWERLASLLATAPADAFAVAGKGTIEPGRDADLVVWSPDADRVVRAADLHDGRGVSPYEGLRVRGAIRCVVRAGRPEAPG